MGFSCFVLGILFLCFGHSEVLFFFCFCFPPFFAFWVLWISMFVLGERNCVCNWVARYVVYNSVFSVLLWNLKAFALSNQLVELCWFGAIFYFFFFFFVSIIYELSLSLSLWLWGVCGGLLFTWFHCPNGFCFVIPSFSILTANHTARGLFVPNDFFGFWFSSLLGYSFVFIHLFTTGHSLLPTSASCPQLLYSLSLSHTVLCFSILQRGFFHHCLLSLCIYLLVLLLILIGYGGSVIAMFRPLIGLFSLS